MGLEWKLSILPGHFRSLGYDVKIFRPLGYGTIDIETNADRLIDFCYELDSLELYNGIHVVGHSMGGLVARMADYKVSGYCNSIATLGTPHYGAPLARLAPWSHAAQQMRPSSGFLRRLNACDGYTPMLTIGASHDPLVPFKNSVVDAAKCRKVYGTHTSMLFDSRVANELIDWFEEQKPEMYN